MKYRFFLLFFFFFIFLIPKSSFSASNEIVLIKISDAIGPAIADHLIKGIKKAEDNDAACIIIQLDTPGGLAESMRKIVMAILGSRIPVVVYVSPAGARAASAGVMITMAADIAVMAPGTNIGAAHPVGVGGKEIDKTMSEKIINDMVASAKSIAKKRGRNVEWAEKAIRESVSITETEALKKNVIDYIARDFDDLIKQINGKKMKGKGTLDLDNYHTHVLKENLRTKILKTISNPNIAYIFMMIGLAGIYFELSHPGAILPGVVGAVSLVLAFFALQTLPVNYAGILLIFLAILFFIMELQIISYGLLSIAGIISLLLGSLMLFESHAPGMGLSWSVLLPTVIIVSAFFIVISGIVFKSQLTQAETGAAGLIGKTGVVKNAIMPDGKVFIHGELWNATSKQALNKGEKIRVVRIVNLVLEVEPVD